MFVDEDRQVNLEAIRSGIRALCKDFPESYWREKDDNMAYPEEFIEVLTKEGWLSVLIPEEYGGAGLGVLEASVILEEINRSGGECWCGTSTLR